MSKDLALEVMEQELHLSTGTELLNWTKTEITDKAQSIVFAVSEGIADPLQEYIKVRKGKEFFDQAEKNLKHYIDGLTLNKGENYFGCEFTEKNLGVSFDYTVCNDPEWNELNAELIAIMEKKKAREEFLKGVSKSMELVNTETGETYTLIPPIKSGKLGKSISIK